MIILLSDYNSSWVIGPREMLSSIHYITDHVRRGVDFLYGDYTPVMSDLAYNIKLDAYGLNRYSAFLNLLISGNVQFICEAIQGFISDNLYGTLLDYLKDRGFYQEYEDFALNILGTVDEDEIVAFVNGDI